MAKFGEMFEQTAARYETIADGDMMVVGSWMDDPDTLSGVFAAVHNGKLIELVIPNSYLRLDATTLSTIINAVICNAFLEWARKR